MNNKILKYLGIGAGIVSLFASKKTKKTKIQLSDPPNEVVLIFDSVDFSSKKIKITIWSTTKQKQYEFSFGQPQFEVNEIFNNVNISMKIFTNMTMNFIGIFANNRKVFVTFDNKKITVR